jgi:hypothetical protein
MRRYIGAGPVQMHMLINAIDPIDRYEVTMLSVGRALLRKLDLVGFVDIRLAQPNYATADCNDGSHPKFPNTCLVTTLNALQSAMACANDDNTKRDNLKLGARRSLLTSAARRLK